MLRNLRERIRLEARGFTLIELLVVILIIGILAAIALPAFLNQQKKGQDSEAKSNARNLVSQVESCYADTQNYTQCDGNPATELTNTGLDLGAGPGQVRVSAAGAAPTNTFTVTALSKSGNTFNIAKGATGTTTRSCSPANDGGCKTGGTW